MNNSNLKDKIFLDWDAVNKRVLAQLQSRKISKYALAEAINFSQGNLSRIFKGKSNFSLEVLAKICSYLNVSMDYILFGTDKNNEAELRNEIARLSSINSISLPQ